MMKKLKRLFIGQAFFAGDHIIDVETERAHNAESLGAFAAEESCRDRFHMF
jgi:hypothetical protein